MEFESENQSIKKETIIRKKYIPYSLQASVLKLNDMDQEEEEKRENMSRKGSFIV